jgi:hypothetical protein
MVMSVKCVESKKRFTQVTDLMWISENEQNSCRLCGFLFYYSVNVELYTYTKIPFNIMDNLISSWGAEDKGIRHNRHFPSNRKGAETERGRNRKGHKGKRQKGKRHNKFLVKQERGRKERGRKERDIISFWSNRKGAKTERGRNGKRHNPQ